MVRGDDLITVISLQELRLSLIGISCLGFTIQLTLFDFILQCNFIDVLFVIRTKIIPAHLPVLH